MYYYPSHYDLRYEYPSDYYEYARPSYSTTRYYIGNPYISSYNDGRYELLRRTPIYSSRASSLDRELPLSREVRATSIPLRELRASSIPPRESRASSIPPRATSPVAEDLHRRARASSVPPRDPFFPSIVHFTPKMADSSTPATTYSYYSRLPTTPTAANASIPEPPKRMYTANPVTFGPRVYTSLSVFPTMKHSSYNLLSPIERYRYRTVPTKSYSSYPSNSYYSYPTPTRSTASAYRQSDLYPTRFQINRVTSPSVDAFYAGRRTQY